MTTKTKRAARQFAALLTAAGVILAGCSKHSPNPVNNSTPSGSKAASAPTSTGSAPALPAGTITWDNAGKPVKQLKIGDSATYFLEGLTITMKVSSFQKASNYPPAFNEDSDNCGNWWVANITATVSAKNLTWAGWWGMPLAALGAILDDQPELGPNHTDDKSPGGIGDEVPGLFGKLEANASSAHKNLKDFAPYTVTGDEYYANCFTHYGKNSPRDTTPVGLVWSAWGVDTEKADGHARKAVEWRL